MKKQQIDPNQMNLQNGELQAAEPGITQPELELNELDLNAAWETFQRKAAQEPVPAIWSQLEYKPAIVATPALAPVPARLGADAKSPLNPAGPSYQEEVPRRSRKTARLLRRWTAGVAAAAIAGTILFTPVGSDALASLLQSFRLQHLNTVSVSMEDLQRIGESLTKGTNGATNFDLSQFGQMTQQGGGAARLATAAEAAQLSGYPLKQLPGSAGATATWEVQPPLQLVLQLHTGPINKLITQLGGKSKLPGSMEDQPIQVEVPAIVKLTSTQKGSAKTLFQMQAPSLEVPEGIDVNQVRRAVLDLPLLPAEMKTKLEGIEDWRHTLPLPAIEGKSIETKVAGREAMINSAGQIRSLLWLDNGIVYHLSGSLADYPTDNDLLAEAKEIIGP